ncbi:MAG: hypothetical protein KatS3mg104_0498 [Phycisphaerae bacterium]|nr:MAG: hypothetical protein KatS3mg104_0498 [Phycisphaerae bacterium]
MNVMALLDELGNGASHTKFLIIRVRSYNQKCCHLREYSRTPRLRIIPNNKIYNPFKIKELKNCRALPLNKFRRVLDIRGPDQ